MAKLPSADVFGERPTPQTRRAIVSPRTGIAEQAEADAARGLQRAAQQAFDFGVSLDNAERRIRSRGEAVALMKAINNYNESAATELRRLQTEADLSDLEVTKQYGKFLASRKARLLGSFRGSEESRLRLEERLEGIQGSYTGQIGSLGAQAEQQVVQDMVGQRLQPLVTKAIEAPNSLPELYQSLDQIIEDAAKGLTPAQESALQMAGRREITLSAVNALVARGSVAEARDLFDTTPGLKEMLTPAQRRNIDAQFAAYDRAERDARLAGLRERQQLDAFLGRTSTMADRLQAKGLLPDTPKALTDAGKVIQDRQLFVQQYGEGSLQVQAFDEMTDSGATSVSDVAGIRKEFTKLSADFVKVRDAFGRISAAAQNPSAAGDLALIFNYMKMLDPGSTVREGEFATAQNTAGVPGRIVSMYNRVLRGERLNVTQRADFLTQSENLMRTQLKSHLDLEEQYRGIAERAKANPDDVLIDFVGPFREAAANPNVGGQAGGGRLRVPYDLKGNPIGGGSQPPSGEK